MPALQATTDHRNTTTRPTLLTRGLQVGLIAFTAGLLSACATTTPAPPPIVSSYPGFPHITAAASSEPIRPSGTYASPTDILLPTPAAPGGITLKARFQEIDDHYAKNAAETRQLLQHTIDGLKTTASASDLVALKSTVTQLEPRISTLTAALTRSDATVTSLTARLQAAERLLTEAAATQEAQTSGASTSKGRAATQDPAENQLREAMQLLQGPAPATEPLRLWITDHPVHHKTPDALLQLSLAFLDRHYPIAAAFYLRRLVSTFPTTIQATEAHALLSSLTPSRPLIKPQVRRATPVTPRAKQPSQPSPQTSATPRPLPDNPSESTTQPLDRSTLRPPSSSQRQPAPQSSGIPTPSTTKNLIVPLTKLNPIDTDANDEREITVGTPPSVVTKDTPSKRPASGR
jgi:hypothetical protein